tara:strand:+ start:3604 stop:3795 length:192 start_codon:yes stop_codon:yes gene_type:complete
MEYTGVVERFVGLKGIIRPDTWGQTRTDVHFNKTDYDFKIGDRVVYTKTISSSRTVVATLRKK